MRRPHGHTLPAWGLRGRVSGHTTPRAVLEPYLSLPYLPLFRARAGLRACSRSTSGALTSGCAKIMRAGGPPQPLVIRAVEGRMQRINIGGVASQSPGKRDGWGHRAWPSPQALQWACLHLPRAPQPSEPLLRGVEQPALLAEAARTSRTCGMACPAGYPTGVYTRRPADFYARRPADFYARRPADFYTRCQQTLIHGVQQTCMHGVQQTFMHGVQQTFMHGVQQTFIHGVRPRADRLGIGISSCSRRLLPNGARGVHPSRRAPHASSVPGDHRFSCRVGPFAASNAATTAAGRIGRVCDSITQRVECMGSLKHRRSAPQRRRLRQGSIP